jgi:nucleotide-binding universal stress UspA family protein
MKSLLVAVDGSDHAWKALDLACDLARQYGSEILVLSVYRHHSLTESSHSMISGRERVEHPDAGLHQLAREVVDQGVARAKSHGVAKVEGAVRRGPPARTIIKTAEERHVDAIVMGSRGLGDVEGILLGSVSHKVCSLADCTCITVK